VMYETARGVPQAYAESLRLYRLAANRGNPFALNNLGLMYRDGRGVPRDDVQASMWLNLAAARFPPGPLRNGAMRERDALAARMTPAQIAQARRLARECDAAHPPARPAAR